MPRAVDGTKRKDRRKKILEQAKGYYGRRSTNHRIAKDAVAKAGQYAYRESKEKKRDFRKLWIARISAAVQAEGLKAFGNAFLVKTASLMGIRDSRRVVGDYLFTGHLPALQEASHGM